MNVLIDYEVLNNSQLFFYYQTKYFGLYKYISHVHYNTDTVMGYHNLLN